MQTSAPGPDSLPTDQRLAALLYGDNLRAVEEILTRNRGEEAIGVSLLVELRRLLGPLSETVVRDIARRTGQEPDRTWGLARAHELARTVNDPHPLGLCINAPCAARGGAEVERVFRDKLIPFEELPCQGACDLGPIACYSRGAPLGISAARARTLAKADPRDWEDLLAVEKPVHAFKTEPRVTFANIFAKGSHQLATARRHGVYQAAEDGLKGSAELLLEKLDAAGLRNSEGVLASDLCRGLRERGGAGRILVIDGNETEPGTFKDRVLLERDPHLVLAGTILAAYAADAREVFLCVRAEYELAFERIRMALEEATRAGHLPGIDERAGRFTPRIRIRAIPGRYCLSEPGRLFEALEGRLPAENGPGSRGELLGKPAVSMELETVMAFPAIALEGGAWYRALGVPPGGGTKVVCLGGDVKRPGNYEVAQGRPIGTLIEELGEGLLQGKRVVALQLGGASQPFLAPEVLALPYDGAALAPLGGALGSGAVVAITEKNCLWNLARREADFLLREGCGGCGGCREARAQLPALLDRAGRRPVPGEGIGEGAGPDDAALRTLAQALLEQGCRPIRHAARPALSVIDTFPAALREHREGLCVCVPRKRGREQGVSF